MPSPSPSTSPSQNQPSPPFRDEPNQFYKWLNLRKYNCFKSDGRRFVRITQVPQDLFSLNKDNNKPSNSCLSMISTTPNTSKFKPKIALSNVTFVDEISIGQSKQVFEYLHHVIIQLQLAQCVESVKEKLKILSQLGLYMFSKITFIAELYPSPEWSAFVQYFIWYGGISLFRSIFFAPFYTQSFPPIPEKFYNKQSTSEFRNFLLMQFPFLLKPETRAQLENNSNNPSKTSFSHVHNMFQTKTSLKWAENKLKMPRQSSNFFYRSLQSQKVNRLAEDLVENTLTLETDPWWVDSRFKDFIEDIGQQMIHHLVPLDQSSVQRPSYLQKQPNSPSKTFWNRKVLDDFNPNSTRKPQSFNPLGFVQKRHRYAIHQKHLDRMSTKSTQSIDDSYLSSLNDYLHDLYRKNACHKHDDFILSMVYGVGGSQTFQKILHSTLFLLRRIVSDYPIFGRAWSFETESFGNPYPFPDHILSMQTNCPDSFDFLQVLWEETFGTRNCTHQFHSEAHALASTISVEDPFAPCRSSESEFLSFFNQHNVVFDDNSDRVGLSESFESDGVVQESRDFHNSQAVLLAQSAHIPSFSIDLSNMKNIDIFLSFLNFPHLRQITRFASILIFSLLIHYRAPDFKFRNYFTGLVKRERFTAKENRVSLSKSYFSHKPHPFMNTLFQESESLLRDDIHRQQELLDSIYTEPIPSWTFHHKTSNKLGTTFYVAPPLLCIKSLPKIQKPSRHVTRNLALLKQGGLIVKRLVTLLDYSLSFQVVHHFQAYLHFYSYESAGQHVFHQAASELPQPQSNSWPKIVAQHQLVGDVQKCVQFYHSLKRIAKWSTPLFYSPNLRFPSSTPQSSSLVNPKESSLSNLNLFAADLPDSKIHSKQYSFPNHIISSFNTLSAPTHPRQLPSTYYGLSSKIIENNHKLMENYYVEFLKQNFKLHQDNRALEWSHLVEKFESFLNILQTNHQPFQSLEKKTPLRKSQTKISFSHPFFRRFYSFPGFKNDNSVFSSYSSQANNLNPSQLMSQLSEQITAMGFENDNDSQTTGLLTVLQQMFQSQSSESFLPQIIESLGLDSQKNHLSDVDDKVFLGSIFWQPSYFKHFTADPNQTSSKPIDSIFFQKVTLPLLTPNDLNTPVGVEPEMIAAYQSLRQESIDSGVPMEQKDSRFTLDALATWINSVEILTMFCYFVSGNQASQVVEILEDIHFSSTLLRMFQIVDFSLPRPEQLLQSAESAYRVFPQDFNNQELAEKVFQRQFRISKSAPLNSKTKFDLNNLLNALDKPVEEKYDFQPHTAYSKIPIFDKTTIEQMFLTSHGLSDAYHKRDIYSLPATLRPLAIPAGYRTHIAVLFQMCRLIYFWCDMLFTDNPRFGPWHCKQSLLSLEERRCYGLLTSSDYQLLKECNTKLTHYRNLMHLSPVSLSFDDSIDQDPLSQLAFSFNSENSTFSTFSKFNDLNQAVRTSFVRPQCEKGIISHLINEFVTRPCDDENVRFWMGAALGSFSRSAPWQCKLFMAETPGLIATILIRLIPSPWTASEEYQRRFTRCSTKSWTQKSQYADLGLIGKKQADTASLFRNTMFDNTWIHHEYEILSELLVRSPRCLSLFVIELQRLSDAWNSCRSSEEPLNASKILLEAMRHRLTDSSSLLRSLILTFDFIKIVQSVSNAVDRKVTTFSCLQKLSLGTLIFAPSQPIPDTLFTMNFDYQSIELYHLINQQRVGILRDLISMITIFGMNQDLLTSLNTIILFFYSIYTLEGKQVLKQVLRDIILLDSQIKKRGRPQPVYCVQVPLDSGLKRTVLTTTRPQELESSVLPPSREFTLPTASTPMPSTTFEPWHEFCIKSMLFTGLDIWRDYYLVSQKDLQSIEFLSCIPRQLLVSFIEMLRFDPWFYS